MSKMSGTATSRCSSWRLIHASQEVNIASMYNQISHYSKCDRANSELYARDRKDDICNQWPYMEKLDESEVFFYIVDVGRWENNQ